MKRILSLLVAVMMIITAAGCAQPPKLLETEHLPSSLGPAPPPTAPPHPAPAPTEPPPPEPEPTEPQPTEPEPTEPQPTEPEPTEPQPTEPEPTEPQPTEPEPTEPQPTEPEPTEPQPTEPELSDREQVELQIWVTADDFHSGNWLDTVMNKFETSHQEYRIIWDIQISRFDNLDPYSNVTADVYIFYHDKMEGLIQHGALKELTGNEKEQVLTDNSTTTVNTITYADGGVYGFPINSNTWYMYYNKDVFTAEDVTSLDAMLKKGKVAFPMTNAWFNATFFLANGCTMFGDKSNDPSAGIQFGGEKGYEAAAKMLELSKNPNLINMDQIAAYEKFTTGKVDAIFSGSWDYSALKYALGNKMGVVQLPMVEIGGKNVQMKSFAGSNCVGVNPNSHHPEMAMALAALMASPEIQLIRFKELDIIPAAKELISDPAVMCSDVAMAEINTMTYCAVAEPTINATQFYWTPMSNFGQDILFGEITPDNLKEKVDCFVADLNGRGL